MYYYSAISFILQIEMISKESAICSGLLELSPPSHTLYREHETEVPRIEGRGLHKQRVVVQQTFEIN